MANLQLFLMLWRNGGPTLKTIPEKRYWKQEMQNNDVFSEFSILDFSLSNAGGMNLNTVRHETLDIVNETYHDCLWMALNVKSCVRIQSSTCPSSGVSIFRDTRLAVGRLRQSVDWAPGQPTKELLALL